MTENLKDACGIFGCIRTIHDHSVIDPAKMTIDGLNALQHRGTEGSGLVGMIHGELYKHQPFIIHKGMGLVRDVFSENLLDKFEETTACIGHNRYSTSGKKDGINCIQPFVVHTVHGLIAVAHNGELVKVQEKRRDVLRTGVGLSTDTDSELIAQMLSRALSQRPVDHFTEPDIAKEIGAVMSQLTLSYSLLIMTPNYIYAVRDPWGNRPLSLGVVDDRDTACPLAYFAASETCAFATPVRFLRDIKPGEIVKLSPDHPPETMHVYISNEVKQQSLCIFEYVYFARPDSCIDGVSVWQTRFESGAQLAIESPAEVDIVSNVPESANPAAQGYAEKLGVPYKNVFTRNAYVGRSFIQPSTALRQSAVARKFGVLSVNFVGARVVLVDDSIVRGNTMKSIVNLLKDNGAREVHIRIASPPVRHACYMGINIPNANELIANKNTVQEICEHLNADSLSYLSIDGLKLAVDNALLKTQNTARFNNGNKLITDSIEKEEKSGIDRHCSACFTGKYPHKLDW